MYSPISMGMRYGGKFISYTFLPPLVDSTPVVVPQGSFLEGILYQIDTYINGVDMQPSAVRVNVYKGIDGRHYIIPPTCLPVLSKSHGVNVLFPSDTHVHIRAESKLRFDVSLLKGDALAKVSAKVALCGVRLRSALKDLEEKDLAREQQISTILHRAGLNVRDLYRVYDSRAWISADEPTPSATDAPDIIGRALLTNMVGRSLRALIESIVETEGDAFCAANPHSTPYAISQHRLSTAAAVVKQYMMDSTVLTGPITRILRRKFSAPSSFRINPKFLSLGATLIMACRKLGFYFDVASRTVTSLAPPTIYASSVTPSAFSSTLTRSRYV